MIELTLMDWFATAPYGVSFVAGMLTFLSPCVLPLIPAYLSYISGVSLSELKQSEMLSVAMRLRILRSALLFVLGFSVVFVLLGASMARLMGNLFTHTAFTYAAGGVIILFGLHVARIVQIPWLNYEKRADFSSSFGSSSRHWLREYLAPFLLGFSFALGWTPCIGPIFAGIVSLAASESTKGIALMSLYAAGLGVPFLLSAILVGVMVGWLGRIKAYMRVIELVSGMLLVFIGILIATGGMGRVSEALLRFFS